jgi:hypothetical protein
MQQKRRKTTIAALETT